MAEAFNSSMAPRRGLVREGHFEDTSKTATVPKQGLVQEVCREWLVLEDSALAHQLQSEEIAAHYGHNRERNRLVRQDTPCAKMEQQIELEQALAMQQLQEQMRRQQEKEDEEVARRIAEELEREEELQRKITAIRDEQLARRIQNSSGKIKKKSPERERIESTSNSTEALCTSVKKMDLNEPMSEDEARQWQELCDAELARRLQQQEEEESKFRRDVTDLSTRLAVEVQDRELALMLQEKERARLRRAKEKARLKAKQLKESQIKEESQEYRSSQPPPSTDNIAACIDPTWIRRQQQQQQVPEQLSRILPTTDLDYPIPVQPIVAGQRRTCGPNSQTSSPEPDSAQQSRSKQGKGCSPQ